MDRVRQVSPDGRSKWLVTIALLDLGIEEAARRYGIAWQEDWDNLDSYDYALLEDGRGRQLLLRRHRGMPGPGIEVVVELDADAANAAESPAAALDGPLAPFAPSVAEILDLLGLSERELLWHDERKRHRP